MITAVILTKNEENNIERCINSVLFCDEIIVIDDNSNDNTLEILKKYRVKVFNRFLDDDFSKQRNYGLQKATNKWVLFIDADEVIPKLLRNEILKKIKVNNINGYNIGRDDFIFGKKIRYGDLKNVKLLRLGKKNNGIWKGKVHEVWEIKGKVTDIENKIMHYPHQSIDEFLNEINFYSTLRAKELFIKNTKVNPFLIVFYTFFKFFYLFFLKLGFLDGITGLIHAFLMSFYSFQVRVKLYLLINKKTK